MALSVRKLTLPLLFTLASAFNALKKEVAAGIGSAKVHADISSKPTAPVGDYLSTSTPDIVTSANASDLATSITLVNELKAVYNRHVADDLAHKVGTSPAVATAAATDLATGQTLANAIKAAYETHRASTTYHYAADAANAIAAADATDQSSLNTLCNELKTDLNLHINAALTTPSLKLLDP